MWLDRRRWTVGEPSLRAHTLFRGVAQAWPGGAQASPLGRQFFRTSLKLTWFWASPDPGPVTMLPATPSRPIHFPAAGSLASQLEQDPTNSSGLRGSWPQDRTWCWAAVDSHGQP